MTLDSPLDWICYFFSKPVAKIAVRYAWMTPNRVSFASFLVGGVGVSIGILAMPLWAAAAMCLLGYFLDCLDGDIARLSRSASPQGAVFDAVLDRYTDFAAIGTLTLVTASRAQQTIEPLIFDLSTQTVILLIGLTALLGAMLTPYVKAKSEAEGLGSIKTLGSRGTRNSIFIVGLAVGQPLVSLAAIAAIGNYSAIHRLCHALRTKDSRLFEPKGG